MNLNKPSASFLRFCLLLSGGIVLAAAQQLPARAAEPVLLAEAEKSEFELGKIDNSKPVEGPLDKKQLDELLSRRVPGNMGLSFYRFTNMYLLPGKDRSGQAISFETTSDRIGKTLLRSPFPSFYRPTLRQFLNEIAWQTRASWKYDYDQKTINTRKQNNPDLKQIALFDFSESQTAKPFQLAVSKGWTQTDNGNWVMYSPPEQGQGSLDVYEMGTYTAEDKTLESQLLSKVPQEVSLEWARRVQRKVKPSDFSRAKVGRFDAVHFETSVNKFNSKQEVHWRQWVFMNGEQCYFIVSTLFPGSEGRLLPDVEAMLKSFQTSP